MDNVEIYLSFLETYVTKLIHRQENNVQEFRKLGKERIEWENKSQLEKFADMQKRLETLPHCKEFDKSKYLHIYKLYERYGKLFITISKDPNVDIDLLTEKLHNVVLQFEDCFLSDRLFKKFKDSLQYVEMLVSHENGGFEDEYCRFCHRYYTFLFRFCEWEQQSEMVRDELLYIKDLKYDMESKRNFSQFQQLDCYLEKLQEKAIDLPPLNEEKYEKWFKIVRKYRYLLLICAKRMDYNKQTKNIIRDMKHVEEMEFFKCTDHLNFLNENLNSLQNVLKDNRELYEPFGDVGENY